MQELGNLIGVQPDTKDALGETSAEFPVKHTYLVKHCAEGLCLVT